MSFDLNRASLVVFFIAAISVCLTGCPDKSYQAPMPDYSNMSDDGGTTESSDDR